MGGSGSQHHRCGSLPILEKGRTPGRLGGGGRADLVPFLSMLIFNLILIRETTETPLSQISFFWWKNGGTQVLHPHMSPHPALDRLSPAPLTSTTTSPLDWKSYAMRLLTLLPHWLTSDTPSPNPAQNRARRCHNSHCQKKKDRDQADNERSKLLKSAPRAPKEKLPTPHSGGRRRFRKLMVLRRRSSERT